MDTGPENLKRWINKWIEAKSLSQIYRLADYWNEPKTRPEIDLFGHDVTTEVLTLLSMST